MKYTLVVKDSAYHIYKSLGSRYALRNGYKMSSYRKATGKPRVFGWRPIPFTRIHEHINGSILLDDGTFEELIAILSTKEEYSLLLESIIKEEI